MESRNAADASGEEVEEEVLVALTFECSFVDPPPKKKNHTGAIF